MNKPYNAWRMHKSKFNFQPNPECCLTGIALNDLKNHTGIIVFIWLKNKKGYWFYINSFRGGYLEGYALINDQWVYQRISLFQIYSYY